MLFQTVALLAVACGLPAGLERPPESEIKPLLLEQLSSARDARRSASRLIVAEPGPDGLAFRPATDADLAVLWLPEPIDDLRLETMSCFYFPVWRVAFRPIAPGHAGPPLVSEVVLVESIPALVGSNAARSDEAPSGWRLVARWWPMRPIDGGRLAPDFRPLARGTTEREEEIPRRLIVVYPPWAIPR